MADLSAKTLRTQDTLCRMEGFSASLCLCVFYIKSLSLNTYGYTQMLSINKEELFIFFRFACNHCFLHEYAENALLWRVQDLRNEEIYRCGIFYFGLLLSLMIVWG